MLWIWVLALPTYPIVLDIFSHQNIIWIHIITKQWNVQINSSLQPARAPPEETSPSWDRSHPTHIFPCLVKDVLLTLTIRDGERNSDFFHDSIKVTHLCLLPSAAWTPQWHDHLRFVFIGPESDHWECLSITHSLTDSLTHSLTHTFDQVCLKDVLWSFQSLVKSSQV